MSTFDISIFGSANLKQPINQFGVLEKMVASLNEEMRQTVQLQGMATNAKGYANMSRAVTAGSAAFRNAAASTGMFAAEQLRVNSATETYTKALQKQKLTFRQWYKDRSIANKAFREQLALQQMMVRQLPNTRGGKTMLDVVRPNAISAVGNASEIARQKMGWFNEQLKSSSKQLVNWGKNTQWAGRQLMVGLTLPIAAFGAVSGKLAYDVDKQMTRIQKVYDTTANQFSSNVQEQMKATLELGNVRADAMNTAKAAAVEYGASVTDTLDVQAELAATGQKGAELQKATSEIMRVATLGEMEHADAINATISLQSVFSMSTKELTESFNYMNAVENATSLQLKDFAKAIPIAAAPVKAFGGDLHELGVLLTAMRENGIGAVQGANALKAAMQRLSRPSKQIQEEFQAITGQSIVDLVDNSSNLTEIFTKLGEATKDLNDNEKRDVFAGLFGSYQVTRMSALVTGMDKLAKGTGQVSAAAKLAGTNVDELAAIADREMKAIQESASGRFKIAIETMKANMAEMGVPFLEVGTQIVELIAKIISKFNELPDAAKDAFVWGAIATAVIGPLIMLTGLFANLAGNVIRLGSSFAGLILKFEILDKESAAAKLIANTVATGWDTEATAAERNAMMIAKMTAAMQESVLVQQNMMRASQGLSPIGQYFPTWQGNQAGAKSGRSIKVPSVLPLNGITSQATLPQSLITSAPMVAKSTEKIKEHMSGAAISGGVFAGAMAASMLSSNETVDKVAHIAMVMAFVGPGLLGLIKLLGSVNAAWLASGASGVKAAVMTSGAWNGVTLAVGRTRMAMALMPGVMAKTAVAAGGLASGIYAALGPVGLLIAGLTAAFLALKKMREEAAKAGEEYKEMYNNAEPLSEIYGYTLTEQADIDIDAKGSEDQLDRVRKIANEYSGVIDKIKAAEGGQNKYNEALRIGMQVLSSGGTVEQARQATRDALTAAQGEADAKAIMLKFDADLNKVEWAVQNAAQTAGMAFGEAMGSATTKSFNEQFEDDFVSNKNWVKTIPVLGSYLDFFGGDDGFDISNEAKEALLSQARDLRTSLDAELQHGGNSFNYWSELQSRLAEIDSMIASSSTGEEADKWKAFRKEFIMATADVSGLSKKFEGFSDEVLYGMSAVDLLNELLIDLPETKTIKFNAKISPSMQAIMDGNNALFGGPSGGYVIEGPKFNSGKDDIADFFNEGTDAAEETGREVKEVEANTRAATVAAHNFANALAAAKSINLSDLFRGTMSDIQQGIADDTSSAFDSRMDAALSATQAAGEARLNAFDNHADAASAAMDRRFEARENHIQAMYDKRIKAIQDVIEAEQKADDIRQRLFDAEMSRLDRLNEAANRDIDFNAALNEGNFDEAAKIRNDAEAEATRFELERELDRADQRSERRQKRLDKRIDTLEELRDKALDNLKRIEDAEKASLQRSQERKRAALEAEVEANNNAAEQMWQDRRDFLDEALEDFTGYTAMSSEDLLRHMANWEKEYGQFDLRTEDKFNRTVDSIAKYLRTQIADQRENLMNDAMWETMGGKIATKMIKGAFGMSKEQFFNWMAGGKPPGSGGSKGHAPSAGGYEPGTRPSGKGGYASGGVLPGWTPGRDVHHFSSATGGDLHLSGGEAIMRPEFTRAVGGPAGVAALNQAARSNSFASGGVFGPAGIMGAGIGHLIAGAFKEAILDAGQWATQRDAKQARKMAGSFGSAKPGTYGNATLDAAQVGNALTIARVGKELGASARDIQISLITAMTESTLRNLTYGDRDSVGLFQQRAPWGSFAARTNPAQSAKMFFTGGSASDGYSEPGLFDIANRGNMSMGQAAQAVQVSAYPDRYANWIPMAQALYTAMQKTASGKGGTGAGYVPGAGGWRRASDPGKGWSTPHDYGNGEGSPLYAAADGKVLESRYITSGGSPGNGSIAPNGLPYRSFGETIVLQTPGGPLRYAHLLKGGRFVQAGQMVKGGALIGRSGNTGNSTGPHTHFQIGDNTNASGWMAEHGIALRKGTEFVRKDNTFANLHYGESVLTRDISNDFRKGVQRFAEGPNSTYNLNMYFTGDVNDREELARFVINTIKKADARKPQARRR